jgi:competence protein ComEC
VLRRLALGARFAVTVGVIGWFALLTRFEPSVLRASVMAALAALTFVLARPASTVRLLSLCVTVLVLIDPLLVWSVGWWLSVGATGGIALLAGPIAGLLPGPRGLAGAVGVTTAAQLGVAPVSVAVFGGLPLVSLPANLLAAPVAGPVMMWGLPAGVLAALVPAPVATLVHLPTRLGVRWIALVARVAARAPIGEVGLAALVVLAGAGVAIAALARWGVPRWGQWARVASAAIGVVVATAVVFAAVAGRPTQPLVAAPVGDGARVWRAGAVVVVVDEPDRRLLEGLRSLGVDRVDALVAATRSSDLARSLEPLLRRYQPAIVLAPDGSPLPGARAPSLGDRYDLGRLTLDVVTDDEGAVQVQVAAASG